jgi:protein-S-isoprenylcysteine O-methyltransferase Ste14
MTSPTYTPTPPIACNSFWINHLSMLMIYTFLCYFYVNNPAVITQYVLLIPVAYALPITLWDFFVVKVYQRESTGAGKTQNPIDFSRVLMKYYGFCMIIATVAGLYWLIPEYRDGMYQTFFGLAKQCLPYLFLCSFIYFVFMDTRQANPEDEYWHTGKFFLGYWKEVDRKAIANLARGWLVKAFFLPLMAHFLYNEVGQFANTPVTWDSPFYAIYDQIIRLVLIADLIPACIGYAMTIKFCDNHIRTADDSMRGWFFCLICYPPFWGGLIYSRFLPYMDNYNWSNWLGESSLRWVWATTLVVCMGIYASASVCFGTRWSNLTYRGLMCKGPYAIVRHPAYFFKNISWWLIGIPFIMDDNSSWEDSIKQCLFFMGVSFVYYQRAVTEEKHLSRYPEYRNYALWMNDHGWFSCLSKIPFIRYSPEKYGYTRDVSGVVEKPEKK